MLHVLLFNFCQNWAFFGPVCSNCQWWGNQLVQYCTILCFEIIACLIFLSTLWYSLTTNRRYRPRIVLTYGTHVLVLTITDTTIDCTEIIVNHGQSSPR